MTNLLALVADVGAGAEEELPPLTGHVVPKQQDARPFGAQRASGAEAADVDGLREANDLGRLRKRLGASLRPVVRRHYGCDRAGKLRRHPVRIFLRPEREDAGSARIPLAERERGGWFLRVDDVARLRKFALGAHHPQPALAREIGHLPGLEGVDRHGMPQLLEVLRDREDVRLRASDPGELMRADDDLHELRF